MTEKRIDLSECLVVRLIQPLSKGYHIEQVYSRKSNGWLLHWGTNYVSHICPYDGIFRSCSECGIDEEDFDVNFCLNKEEIVSDKEMIKRIKLAEKAGCEIKYVEGEI